MRKLTYALLAAALAVTVLAGCSRKAEAEGSTQQATSAAQEKPVKADKEKETKAEDDRCLKELAAKGMDVYTVPADEVKLWQDATASVIEKFEQEQGDFGKQLVEDCRKASKK